MKHEIKAIYLLMLLKTDGPHRLHQKPLWPYYGFFDAAYPQWGELADDDKDLAKYMVKHLETQDALDRVYSIPTQ